MSSIGPYHLPQVNAPFSYTIDMLDKEGVDYKYMQADPDELHPSQSIILSDIMDKIDSKNLKAIWISKDNKVIDGHHRVGVALSRGIPIKCIKIMLSQKDAIRILNKIQDIFEYENQEKVMEVVAQDQINVMNDPDSDFNNGNFLESLAKEKEMEDREILHDSTKKPKTMTGYRKDDINTNSVVGNFFSLKPVDGYKKYDMEFDNLMNTNDLDITFKSDINPVARLAVTWFPNIDFKKIAKHHEVNPDSIINRAVAEKAKEMGYDGIKYGDIMVQGLN